MTQRRFIESHSQPYDLLKSIKRSAGGEHYKRLRITIICALKGKDFAAFSWTCD